MGRLRRVPTSVTPRPCIFICATCSRPGAVSSTHGSASMLAFVRSSAILDQSTMSAIMISGSVLPEPMAHRK